MDDWKERLKAMLDAPPLSVHDHVPKKPDDEDVIRADSEPKPDAGKIVSGT